MASYMNIASIDSKLDNATISNSYMNNSVLQKHLFKNIPEVALCLKQTIDGIQNQANDLAFKDTANKDVHTVNGINACNILRQYVAMVIDNRQSDLYPSHKQLLFHMAMHMSYKDGANCTWGYLEDLAENQTPSSIGFEYYLHTMIWQRRLYQYRGRIL